jgi:hypothetical protein
MGEYADTMIDDLMDGNIPRDERDPIKALRREAAIAGLALHRCSDVHYQICDEHCPLVDVWPTTNKFRWHGAPAGAKAKSGSAHKAVKEALHCQKVNASKAAGLPPPTKANGSPSVDDDPFSDKPTAPTDHPDVEKLLARRCYLLRLCQARLEMYGGNVNKAICEEIEESL